MPVAEIVAGRFYVLNQYTDAATGFSGAVFRDRETGAVHFAMRGTESPMDFVADIDLAIGEGVAAKQIVAMVNWYLRLTTPTTEIAPQVEAADPGLLEALVTGKFEIAKEHRGYF